MACPGAPCLHWISGNTCLGSWLWPDPRCPGPPWAPCLALAFPVNWIAQPPDPLPCCPAPTPSGPRSCSGPGLRPVPTCSLLCPRPHVCARVCRTAVCTAGQARVLGGAGGFGPGPPGSPKQSGEQGEGPNTRCRPGSRGLCSANPPLHTLLLISGPLPAKAPVPPFEVWGPTGILHNWRGYGGGGCTDHKADPEAPAKPRGPGSERPPPIWWMGRGGGLRACSPSPPGPHTPSPASKEGQGSASKVVRQGRMGKQSGGSPGSDAPAPPSQPSWPPGPHLPLPIESCFHRSSQVTRSPGLGDIC